MKAQDKAHTRKQPSDKRQITPIVHPHFLRQTRLKLQHSCTGVRAWTVLICKVPAGASEREQQATPRQNTLFPLTLTTAVTAQETWSMSSSAVMFHPAITEQTLSPVPSSHSPQREGRWQEVREGTVAIKRNKRDRKQDNRAARCFEHPPITNKRSFPPQLQPTLGSKAKQTYKCPESTFESDEC